jgi:superfamily I DNA/RNA helicase
MSIRMEEQSRPLKDLVVHPYLFAQHFDGPSERPRVDRGVEEFDWGYVLTVHSAQGSEWPHVTVIDDSAVFREDRDKHLYTAITRASEGLLILKRAGKS